MKPLLVEVDDDLARRLELVAQEDRDGSWMRVEWDPAHSTYIAASDYSRAEPLSPSDLVVVGLADGTSWDASRVLNGAAWFAWGRKQ